MNVNEATKSLGNAYRSAPYGKKMAALHLFGIKYACELEVLQRQSASSRTELLKKLVSLAGVPEPHTTEINKGINLAEYVEVKTDNLWF